MMGDGTAWGWRLALGALAVALLGLPVGTASLGLWPAPAAGPRAFEAYAGSQAGEETCSLPNQCVAWMNSHDKFGSLDVAQAAVVSPNGEILLVAGHTAGATEATDPVSVLLETALQVASDGFATAYHTEGGQRIWTAPFEGDHYTQVWDAAVSQDSSRFYVAGGLADEEGRAHGFVVAYESSGGREAWSNIVDSAAFGNFWAVDVGPDDSTVFATGISHGLGPAVAAFDAETGNLRWTNGSGDAGVSGYLLDLAISPSGADVYAAGFAMENNDKDLVLAAFNATTGAPRWSFRYAGNHREEWGHSVAVSPDGRRVYVHGMVHGPEHGPDYGTFALNATSGEPLWTRLFDGPAGKGDYQKWGARALGLSPDGRVAYVTGSVTVPYGGQASLASAESVNSAFGTIAYDAETGDILWRAFYDPPYQSWDDAVSLLIGPEGQRVYVAGWSWGAGQFDYALVAYEAGTGAQAWERRFDGVIHSWDLLLDAAISGNGSRIFLTGASFQRPFGPCPCDTEALTLAYDSGLPPLERPEQGLAGVGFSPPPPAQPVPAAQTAPLVAGGIAGALGGLMALRMLLAGRKRSASAPNLNTR